jgi:hypothetical protein
VVVCWLCFSVVGCLGVPGCLSAVYGLELSSFLSGSVLVCFLSGFVFVWSDTLHMFVFSVNLQSRLAAAPKTSSVWSREMAVTG